MSRGAETTSQNHVYIGAQFNSALAQKMSAVVVGKVAVFGFNTPAQLDILKHEITFVFKSETPLKKGYQIPRVISALNGAGEQITQLFPKDKLLQQELLLEQLQIVGTADEDMPYDKANGDGSRDFAVQVVGVTNHVAQGTMFAGGLLEYYLPDASVLQGSSYISVSNGRAPGKATIELRHFDASLAGVYLAQRLQSAVFDSDKWQVLIASSGSNGSFGKTGPVWLSAARAHHAMFHLAGLSFLYRILGFVAHDYGRLAFKLAIQGGADAGQVRNAEIAFESVFASAFNTDPVAAKQAGVQTYTSYPFVTYPILSLAKMLNITDAEAILHPEPNTITLGSFESRGKAFHQEFSRQFMASLMFDGRHQNSGIGMNHALPDTANRPFNNGVGGAPLTGSVYGNLVFKQLNTFKMYMSAVMQLIRFRLGNIAGTVVRGGQAGQLFAYYKA